MKTRRRLKLEIYEEVRKAKRRKKSKPKYTCDKQIDIYKNEIDEIQGNIKNTRKNLDEFYQKNGLNTSLMGCRVIRSHRRNPNPKYLENKEKLDQLRKDKNFRKNEILLRREKGSFLKQKREKERLMLELKRRRRDLTNDLSKIIYDQTLTFNERNSMRKKILEISEVKPIEEEGDGEELEHSEKYPQNEVSVMLYKHHIPFKLMEEAGLMDMTRKQAVEKLIKILPEFKFDSWNFRKFPGIILRRQFRYMLFLSSGTLTPIKINSLRDLEMAKEEIRVHIEGPIILEGKKKSKEE